MMSEEEYLDFVHNQQSREKLLDPYEDFIKTRLENCEDASTAQIHQNPLITGIFQKLMSCPMENRSRQILESIT